MLEPTLIPATITRGMLNDAKEGAALFRTEEDLSCHTVAGVGDQRGPDLTDVDQCHSRDELTAWILNGMGQMLSLAGKMPLAELEKVLGFSGSTERALM